MSVDKLRDTILEMGMGYVPDVPSAADYLVRASIPVREETILYDAFMMPVRNQGQEGTCVGFAYAAIKEFYDNVQRGTKTMLSPRFIYNLSKQFDGIPNEEGTYPRVALKMGQKFGISYEEDWPYKPHQKDKPSKMEELFIRALPQRIETYARLWNTRDMVASLLLNGPFVAGVIVTQGWYSDEALEKGVIDASVRKKPNDGGHAIAITGYDVDNKSFRVKNSWSTQYGDNGYMWLPRDWMEEHCIDAWSIVDDKAIDNGLVVVKPEEGN
jgi:C1A family cysteine protease